MVIATFALQADIHFNLLNIELAGNDCGDNKAGKAVVCWHVPIWLVTTTADVLLHNSKQA